MPFGPPPQGTGFWYQKPGGATVDFSKVDFQITLPLAEHEKMRKELEELRAEVKSARSTIALNVTAMVQRDKHADKLEKKIKDLDDNLAARRTMCFESERQVAELKRVNSQLARTVETRGDIIDKQRKELEELKADRERWRQRYVDNTNLSTSRLGEIINLKKELEKLEANHRTTLDIAIRRFDEIEQLKEQVAKHLHTIGVQYGRISELEEKNVKLERDARTWRESHRMALKDAEERFFKIQKLEQEVKEWRTQSFDNAKLAGDRKNVIDGLVRRIEVYKAMVDRLTDELGATITKQASDAAEGAKSTIKAGDFRITFNDQGLGRLDPWPPHCPGCNRDEV